jgi:uncharacterized protein (DUF885 family)
MSTYGRLMLVLLLALIPGCFQAQLNGPISGAMITITPLAGGGPSLEQIQASSRDSNLETFGSETWLGFGPVFRLWFLGNFVPESTQFEPDQLYLLTAEGGQETDANLDRLEDEEYSPVDGTWHAILSGAQLLAGGYQISPLTEAAYQWLASSLIELTDEEILWNLSRAAQAVLSDVNRDNVVDHNDLAAWNSLFHRNLLIASPTTLDQIAVFIRNDVTGSQIESMSAAFFALAIETCPFACEDVATLALAAQLWGLPLADFFQVSFRALMLRKPETIVQLGLEERYGLTELTLDNISDDYVRETTAMAEVILEGLDTFDETAFPEEQQLSMNIYRYYLQDLIEQAEYLLFSYPANSFITGVPRETEFFFSDIHPLTTVQDADNYLARLNRVSAKIEQLRVNVAARVQAGIIEPAITLANGIGFLSSTWSVDATSTDYYQRFSNSLYGIEGLDSATALELRFAARDIIIEQVQPAYQRLAEDLTALEPNAPTEIGFGQFEGGLDFYDYALRHHTTTTLSAAQVHQTGLNDLTRIHQEIRSAAATLGIDTDTDLPTIFNSVASLGGILLGGDILQRYEDLVAEAQSRLPEAFNELPEQEVVVIGGPTGGFYVSGSDDGSRPGAFFAATVGSEAYFMMPSLSYHEAVPGHHLQIALAQEQALPDFRRYTNYTAFVEGWALYAERLAFELGWYDDDAIGNLGRLQFEAIRAARLVLDTGIHNKGWSWDEAVASYQANTGASLGSSQSNVARFMRWPGQATAYMVGMNRLLELRAQMQEAQSDSFSLKDFHSRVLTGAAMPLDILATELN